MRSYPPSSWMAPSPWVAGVAYGDAWYGPMSATIQYGLTDECHPHGFQNGILGLLDTSLCRFRRTYAFPPSTDEFP
jgi:hypothetical protein